MLKQFAREGTAVDPLHCAVGLRTCGGNLDGTTWVLAQTCLEARQGLPPEEWDCTRNNRYNESFEEESTLTFADGVATYHVSHRRWEYRYLTDAEACGVDTCAEVETCARENPAASAECIVEDAGGCRCFVTEEIFDLELSAGYSVYDENYLSGGEVLFESLAPPLFCRMDDLLLVYIPEWVHRNQLIPCPPDDGPCLVPPNFDPVVHAAPTCVAI